MEAKEIIKKDMEALYLGNLNTVEFNLNLPKKGKYGSEIIWKSGHERFLDSEGNVKRPPYGTGDRTISLWATFVPAVLQRRKSIKSVSWKRSLK